MRYLEQNRCSVSDFRETPRVYVSFERAHFHRHGNEPTPAFLTALTEDPDILVLKPSWLPKKMFSVSSRGGPAPGREVLWTSCRMTAQTR